MVSVSEAITVASPYYNLALVAVVVFLFIRLFRTRPTSPDVFMRPWYFLFAIIIVFIIEEITTVLRAAGLIALENVYINGFFEIIIVSLIMYTLLIQREHVKR